MFAMFAGRTSLIVTALCALIGVVALVSIGVLALTGASGALATNGTGSVLAGLVGTLLARGMDPFAAAVAAVLARSDAGDLAATRVGAGHTVAGDVIQALPEALASRRD
jgi:NAD(P)H-hydrate repair Nnr-like enzyme with NAD(P)H-hydrate dehydratase domain